jgi:hypothetical protein
LLDKPWWQRAWVVQEVAVARNILVMCGKESIEWGEFEGGAALAAIACPYLRMLPHEDEAMILPNSKQCESIDDVLLVRKDPFSSRPEDDLLRKNPAYELSTSRTRLCKLDHDRVFSMLAFLPKSIRKALAVDYTQSVEDFYTTVARVCIQECSDTIFSSQHSVWNTHLPSFVPDWRLPPRSYNFATPTFRSRPQSMLCHFSQDSARLTLKGRELTKVTAIEAEDRFFPDIPKERSYTDNSYGIQVPRTNWRMHSDVIQTLMAPGFRRWRERTIRCIPTLLSVFLKLLSDKDEDESFRPAWHGDAQLALDDEDDLPFSRDICQSIMHELLMVLRSRTLCDTTKGLAIAPDTARVGDLVFMIQGLPSLVLLRPEADGTTYRFIGDVFMGFGEIVVFHYMTHDLFWDESGCHEITLVWSDIMSTSQYRSMAPSMSFL